MKCCYLDCHNEAYQGVCCKEHKINYGVGEHRKNLTIKEIQQLLKERSKQRSSFPI